MTASTRNYEVVDCKETENASAPPAPYTTSSLQQAASNALKFTPKQTMQLVQKLYEGGHITYMRTDSPNLSKEAVRALRAFCEEKGWPVVEKPRTWKSKVGAQEAHEVIRPTHVEIEDTGGTADEKAPYRLIRLRSLPSQLADALYVVRILQLKADVDGKAVLFEAKGRTLLAPGWKMLTQQDATVDTDADSDTQEPDNPVPAIKPGSVATALTSAVLTKKTKPALWNRRWMILQKARQNTVLLLAKPMPSLKRNCIPLLMLLPKPASNAANLWCIE